MKHIKTLESIVLFIPRVFHWVFLRPIDKLIEMDWPFIKTKPSKKTADEYHAENMEWLSKNKW